MFFLFPTRHNTRMNSLREHGHPCAPYLISTQLFVEILSLFGRYTSLYKPSGCLDFILRYVVYVL